MRFALVLALACVNSSAPVHVRDLSRVRAAIPSDVLAVTFIDFERARHASVPDLADWDVGSVFHHVAHDCPGLDDAHAAAVSLFHAQAGVTVTTTWLLDVRAAALRACYLAAADDPYVHVRTDGDLVIVQVEDSPSTLTLLAVDDHTLLARVANWPATDLATWARPVSAPLASPQLDWAERSGAPIWGFAVQLDKGDGLLDTNLPVGNSAALVWLYDGVAIDARAHAHSHRDAEQLAGNMKDALGTFEQLGFIDTLTTETRGDVTVLHASVSKRTIDRIDHESKDAFEELAKRLR